MTLSFTSRISILASVTPADELAAGTYNVGYNNVSLPVNGSNVVLSRSLTVTTAGTEVFEPDTNVFDGGSALPDPDGVTVSLATAEMIILKNTDVTNSITYSCDATLGSAAGRLAPGSFAILHNTAGWTLSGTSAITLTATAGSPVLEILVFGTATA